ncbi:hypothetical protein HDU67_000368 [Dinochytrium kinnereticum]|nr:hypothetical protein HDU67_000368 [Dinochytrium kinnereticum]
MAAVTLPHVKVNAVVSDSRANPAVCHDLITSDVLIQIGHEGPVYAFHRSVLSKNSVMQEALSLIDALVRLDFPASAQALRCRVRVTSFDYSITVTQPHSFKKDWKLIYLNEPFSHSNIDVLSLELLLAACSAETSLDRIRIILSWSRNWPVSGNRLPAHKLILAQAGDGKGDGSVKIDTLWELSNEFPGSFDAIIPVSLILKLQKEVMRDVAECKYCRLKLPLTEFDGKTRSCPRAKIYYACGCGGNNTSGVGADQLATSKCNTYGHQTYSGSEFKVGAHMKYEPNK